MFYIIVLHYYIITLLLFSIFWTLNRLVPIEVHYVEKNVGMFSSKTLISFRLKKERHGHLG